jgi:predicted DNA-binding transcriptional regulator YafY
VIVPAGFDLDCYIQEGEFAYPVGEPIRLEAVFSRGAAFHLSETPLSADQRVTDLDDARVVVHATVENTAELRWWLCGFGAEVEVLAPADLREEFRAIAAAMATVYQQRSRAMAKGHRSRRAR